MNAILGKIWKDIKEQFRALSLYLLLFFYVPVFIVLLVALGSMYSNPAITADILFRDITATTDVSFYYGFVSQLGLVLWTVVATSCFFALFFLHKFDISSQQVRRFLLHSALLSTFLLIDDMFLLHEEILPDYLNISQGKLLISYPLLFVIFAYINRKALISSEYLPLVFAGVAFFLSISVDLITDKFIVHPEDGSWYEMYETFIEDSLKFFGIASWTAYYLRYVYSNFAPLFENLIDNKKRQET